MKKLLVILLVLITVACTTQTEYGKCIGLGSKEDPNLTYEISARNTVIAILLLETLVVPLITLLDDIKCPTSKK